MTIMTDESRTRTLDTIMIAIVQHILHFTKLYFCSQRSPDNGDSSQIFASHALGTLTPEIPSSSSSNFSCFSSLAASS